MQNREKNTIANNTNSGGASAAPLYNSRIIDNYIKLIRRKYNHVNIEVLLHYAEMTPYEVADEGHWFTQDQINRFHEKLSLLTNNEFIAREAGRYAASPDASGVMRSFLLGLVGPAGVFRIVGSVAGKFTRSAVFSSRIIRSNKVEISVAPNPGVEEKSFQCENRTGFFEAVGLAFTNKLPTIDHTECAFRGDNKCKYVISWDKSYSIVWKRVRNFVVLSPLAFGLGALFINPVDYLEIIVSTLPTFIPTWLAVVFLFSFISGIIEKSELSASLNHLRDTSDSLIEQVNINYNNAVMTNEVGHALSKQTDSKLILRDVIKILRKRLNYDRGMILLADKDKHRLLFRAGYGYAEDQVKLLTNTAFHLKKSKSKGIFVKAFRQQTPFLVNDLSDIKRDLSLRSINYANKLGAQSFICCPIICDGESLGILAVDNLNSKKPLVWSDISLLMGIASVLGISIRNADLMESKDRQFKSILHVLAASIDARDPMTSGHSEKVTEYALGICDELQLPNDYREMIRVAALLHDYGKIGVPDSILKKPGRLTDQEYEVVKTHAEKTKRILSQINFEGIFSQVPEVAGHHHEKLDGSGYPKGLEGEDIPLGARIIAVADFFEAITARRHYRGPMPLKKAFEMLKQESEHRFDPNVVNALFSYYSRMHAGEPEYRASIA